ncbi:putative protein YaeQ [Sinobacterium norvegicum]|uniref:YaeQ family protein n=1 Tax=Sinobacterium norvegicum TaxID=1641715 RepID=A0ABM9AC07_9GAMM|nr:YaeQ family protein [Sinobacterium norvegicum]CAH0990506.1 putative protein YaeQ [Sinobacterium norvegicum]
MALKSTVYKIQLQVSNLNNHYYAEHLLSVACHPSESSLRMLARVLAFAVHADERLQFGRGLSEVEDAALWLKDDTGLVKLWVEMGNPSVDRIKWLRGKADSFAVYSYQESAQIWWQKNAEALQQLKHCQFYLLPEELLKQQAEAIGRQTNLHIMLSEQSVMITGDLNFEFELQRLDQA